MELELLKKIDNINFKKVQEKAIVFIAGVFGTYLFISLVSKFVNDNWSFRISKISNLPPAEKKSNS